MPYELISDRNMTEGMHVLFVYVNDITQGIFIPLMLFAFYMIIALGLFFNKKRATGFEDMPMCIATAGFSTAILTILLRLIPGLVNTYVIAVVFMIAVVGAIWFFFTRE